MSISTGAAPSAQTTPPRGSAAPWERWQPATGIGFVVLFIAGFMIFNTPDDNATNAKWTSYYASSGNRISLVLSAFLLVLSALCFISFVTTAWSRVAAALRPHTASPLPMVAAGVAAAGIAVGAVLNATIAGAMVFGNLAEPSAETLRVFSELAFPVITVAGMLAAGLALASLSMAAFRSGVLGKRMAIFGMVAAVAAVFSFVFLPMLLPLAWVLVASVLLLRQPATA